MRRPRSSLALLLFAALALPACQAPPQDKAPAAAAAPAAAPAATAVPAAVLPGFEGWPTAQLEIRAASGRQWFHVVVADTPEHQERGLMFVTELPHDVGMLFPQDMPQVIHMWMKDTLIPLDMLFIGADQRVLYIRANAPVESLDIISTPLLAQSVLEINGGEAARRGIKVGDTIAISGLAGLK